MSDKPDYKNTLNLPRSPQGRPVFVQAGSSDTGRRFAARHAEAVFTAHLEKATAKAFYTDLKGRAVAKGIPDFFLKREFVHSFIILSVIAEKF